MESNMETPKGSFQDYSPFNSGERPAMGPGFLHNNYFNSFASMATGNMIRELKLQLIVEFL